MITHKDIASQFEITNKQAMEVIRIQTKLKISLAEAVEIVKYDKLVDKTSDQVKLAHDLNMEQRDAASALMNGFGDGGKSDEDKPERKPKPKKEGTDTKEGIMSKMAEAFQEMGASVTVVNASRELSADLNGKNYKLLLTETRAKKK